MTAIEAGRDPARRVGTPEKIILEQLTWFAKEVMPAFKATPEKPLEAGASTTSR